MNEAEAEYIAAVRVTAGEAQSRRAAKALGRPSTAAPGVLPASATVATKSDHLERATGIVRKLTEESRKLRRLCASAPVAAMPFVMVPADAATTAPVMPLPIPQQQQRPVVCPPQAQGLDCNALKMHAMEQFAAAQQYHHLYSQQQQFHQQYQQQMPPQRHVATPVPVPGPATAAWGYPVKPYNGFTGHFDVPVCSQEGSFSVLGAEDKASLKSMGVTSSDHGSVAKALLQMGAIAASKLAASYEQQYQHQMLHKPTLADGCADGYSDPESVSSLEAPSSPDCTYAECA